MNSLKRLILAFAAMLLVCLCAVGAADSAVNCYWQLDAVEVDAFASDKLGSPEALASAKTLSGLDVEEMIAALRGENTLSLGMTRVGNGKTAKAAYTYSTVPALVPGAAAARLNVTAETSAEGGSYYLYSTINAASRQVARVRGNGAWVVRTFFPRQATPGQSRVLSLYAKESNDLARVRVNYVYKAVPGAMQIDTNGDIVLYDLDGNEVRRIHQKVEDMLPVMLGASSAGSEGDTVFAAEKNDDGSVIVRMNPASGLTHSELIQLIRAAVKSAMTDAASAATYVSTLESDPDAATIYLAPGAKLSDDVLSALIAAAQSAAIDVAALQGDVSSGAVSVAAEMTPSPAPLTLSQILGKIEAGDVSSETDETAEDGSTYAASGSAAQAVVLYGETGVEAVVMTPGAEASGSELLEAIHKLEEAGSLSKSYADTFGRDASELGLTGEAGATSTMVVEGAKEGVASVSASGMENSTWLNILPGSVADLLDQLTACSSS